MTIHMLNSLPSNSPPLSLRCKSKDDDLGYHTVAVNQDFHWSFCENIFGRTLFFCHLYWGSKQSVFDVFHSKDVKAPMFDFWWAARSDGIYFCYYNDTAHFDKTFDWN
ncbi:hypothetical protein CASFOL_035333 [Castilleja foliolosa]|uniref:S-protein homolog n=1 Tax=Castilleja foliolosa TaxID=1961234 RepID=A0ABD3BSC8_9LAMI